MAPRTRNCGVSSVFSSMPLNILALLATRSNVQLTLLYDWRILLSAPVSGKPVAFKVYDMDRDGYISNGELFLVLKMMVGNNLKDQQLQQITDKTIMEADHDGDGKISFEEFQTMVANTDVRRATLPLFFSYARGLRVWACADICLRTDRSQSSSHWKKSSEGIILPLHLPCCFALHPVQDHQRFLLGEGVRPVHSIGPFAMTLQLQATLSFTSLKAAVVRYFRKHLHPLI